MLQFIAQENERYSIPEQMQMAIEGGCTWIQLNVPDMADDQIRELAREVVPLCKETSTILVIENHVELARELGLHGVHLAGAHTTAAAVREQLGPEAIIGLEVGMASSVLALKGVDIDYATFTGKTAAELAKEVELIRNSGSDLPIVAAGDYPLDKLPEILASGVNGIALSRTISDSHDPVSTTEEIIDMK